MASGIMLFPFTFKTTPCNYVYVELGSTFQLIQVKMTSLFDTVEVHYCIVYFNMGNSYWSRYQEVNHSIHKTF